jgi:hypothetical protein
MKRKIEDLEDILYFLTVWFSVSVITLGVIAMIFKIITKIK